MTNQTTSTNLTAALRYAELGWHVFPCWWPEHNICACGDTDCGSPAKHPIGPAAPHGHRDATTNPQQITDWWTRWPDANIAIALGPSHLFVLDVDGPDGAHALQDLEDSYEPLNATLTADTGRAEGSGVHRYYRQPDEPISNRKLAVKLETRGDGGYVIAPPSIHISGRAYTWRDTGLTAAAEPNPWLVAIATRPTPADPAPPTPPGQHTSVDELARRRLEGAAGKVALAPEGERNDVLNWAAHTAGRLIGAGRLDREHVEHTLTIAAQRAGLTPRETSLTIRSGIEAGITDPDHSIAPSPAAQIVAAVNAPERPKDGDTDTLHTLQGTILEAAVSKIQNGATFILDTDPTIRAIWGNDQQIAWARGEPLIITGPTGVGKTTIAHQLLERRLGTTTDPLFGLDVQPDDRPILYLACDRPTQIRRAFARRFNETHRGRLASRLLVHNGYLPAMVDVAPNLLADLVDHLDVGTLVIDSLKDVATELEKGPNAIAINQALQHVCQAGAQVVILHHQRKSQGDNRRPKSIDDLYGNTLIPSGAGSVLLVWGKPGDLAVELHHLKQPAEQIGPLQLIHDHEHGTTRLDADEQIDLVALARNQTGGLTAKAAAQQLYGDQTRTSIERARRELNRLAEKGLVEYRDGVRGGPSGGTAATWWPVVPQASMLDDERYR